MPLHFRVEFVDDRLNIHWREQVFDNQISLSFKPSQLICRKLGVHLSLSLFGTERVPLVAAIRFTVSRISVSSSLHSASRAASNRLACALSFRCVPCFDIS